MKNLTNSMKALSFCFILSAAFLVVGCNDDVATSEDESSLQMNEILEGQKFILPQGFDNLDQEKEYLRTISDAEALKLINNYKVAMFLQAEQKIGDISTQLKDVQHLSDLDLTTVFTNSQLQELENFDPNTVVESRRHTCSTTSGWCWTRKRCCFNDSGQNNHCWIVWQYRYC